MSTKALKKQLMAAIAMVVVAAVALGSSTYAWFTLNNKVTATGMSVTTQVGNNLLIAPSTLAQTAYEEDTKFTTSYVDNIKALLEPVSTVNGTSFFYTKNTNVLGSGDAINDAYEAYAATEEESMNDFNTNAGTTDAVGYVDYIFQLKAMNTDANEAKLQMTKLALTYGDYSATAAENTRMKNAAQAFRVAVFLVEEDTDAENPFADYTADDLTVTMIYKNNTTDNFTTNQAVASATALGAVTYNTESMAEATIDANTTKYYKVIVRLWLEGEDENCNNTTFAKLDSSYNLDLAFELAKSDVSKTTISELTTTNRTAIKVNLSSGATVNADSDMIKIGSTTYYQITGKTLTAGGDKLYTTATNLTKDSHVFIFENDLYPIDVTNQVTLPE